ncbi:lysylphosphatidylglycerol synthase transmembrane domain-containing protein [Pyrococcus kukulkanii]|uniref:lysylphosphatidylglycerol synthase transmembrane domain-containing protein n=1 Tax=Pyrococcus kukulkanii TaxID=1609559 RepID=UPI0035682A02
MRKRKIFSVILLLLSLVYIVRTIRIEEIKTAISMADLKLLSLAFGMAFSSILLSTLRWYIALREVQDASFRKTFAAILSGFYMMAFLPPSVGHAAKVKLVGGDYLKALSTLIFGISLEILILVIISLLVFGVSVWKFLLLGLLLVPIFYDSATHNVLQAGLRLIRRINPQLAEKLRNYFERIHFGWRNSKKNPSTFAVLLFLSMITVLLQVSGIIIVGKAFGFSVGLLDAIKAFILSTFFAAISGIPSGIGANELGITLALGSSTKSTLVAFTYKFIYQYVWSFVGAVEFYKMTGGKS